MPADEEEQTRSVDFDDLVAGYAEAMRPIIEAINASSQIQQWFKNLPEPAVIAEAFARLPGDVQRALAACGFPSVNSFLSMGGVRRFVQIFDSDGRGAALDYIQESARAWLATPSAREKILADWSACSTLLPRMPILRDALGAHAEQKYNLSVPLFIIQLEGVLASATGHVGYMGQRKYVGIAKTLVADEKLFGDQVAMFIEHTLLADFNHGDDVFEFSRHAVLHGADYKYGNELNSLRAIALFDYIVDLIEIKRAKVNATDV